MILGIKGPSSNYLFELTFVYEYVHFSVNFIKFCHVDLLSGGTVHTRIEKLVVHNEVDFIKEPFFSHLSLFCTAKVLTNRKGAICSVSVCNFLVENEMSSPS